MSCLLTQLAELDRIIMADDKAIFFVQSAVKLLDSLCSVYVKSDGTTRANAIWTTESIRAFNRLSGIDVLSLIFINMSGSESEGSTEASWV